MLQQRFDVPSWKRRRWSSGRQASRKRPRGCGGIEIVDAQFRGQIFGPPAGVIRRAGGAADPGATPGSGPAQHRETAAAGLDNLDESDESRVRRPGETEAAVCPQSAIGRHRRLAAAFSYRKILFKLSMENWQVSGGHDSLVGDEKFLFGDENFAFLAANLANAQSWVGSKGQSRCLLQLLPAY